MNDNHPENCLHCAFVKLIHERYPAGVDRHACESIVNAMAVIAGDIMARAVDPDQTLEAFTEVTYRAMLINPRQINVVFEARN